MEIHGLSQLNYAFIRSADGAVLDAINITRPR